MNRRQLVLDSLTLDRRQAALGEAARLRQFAVQLGCPIELETVMLYLTDAMSDAQINGRKLREKLTLLDIAASLEGRSPWTSDEAMRRYIRGMYRLFPRRASLDDAVDPLYPEMVRALVDALLRPTVAQIQDGAMLRLAHYGQLHASQLSRLAWEDVQFKKGCVYLQTTTSRGRSVQLEITNPADVRELQLALRSLFRIAGQGQRRLFSPRCRSRIGGRLVSLGYPASVAWSADRKAATVALNTGLERLGKRSAKQIRDAAILLTASSAWLSTRETVDLQVSALRLEGNGMTIRIPTRRHEIFLPRSRDRSYCPVGAWEQWLAFRRESGVTHSVRPAFLALEGARRLQEPMSPTMLNLMIGRLTETAELDGRYGFMSLRFGGIRGGVREDMPVHAVAAKAGLACLISVDAHRRREEVISSSVAGMIGL